jgi:hypothetical protein
MTHKVFANNPLLGGEVKQPDIPMFSGGFAGFVSTILKFVYIAAGLYAFWNFIVAGYMFLSAGGDPEAIGKAWGTIWKSLMGLILIVSATVFAALIGWLFFNNPTAILKPELAATPAPAGP